MGNESTVLEVGERLRVDHHQWIHHTVNVLTKHDQIEQ